jgi:TetR/AcrR family transcriptional regulator, lmrAB and yxaGH operons repressor
MRVIMPSDPRRRMIQSAALLTRERGVEATSFSEVLERSGAPRGSIYHHFPGGKAQLIEESTRYAGDFIAAGLVAALESADPVVSVRAFVSVRALVSLWRAILRESDYGAGCPVVAATLEGDRAPGPRAAAGVAFARWEELLADGLGQRSVAPARARSLATLTIAAIEGAVIVARAQRSRVPLERWAWEVERVAGAIALS